MSSIELSDQEWGQVMNCMGYAPARECVPLLNKIGAQLAQQHLPPTPPNPPPRIDANGQEVRHE